MIELRKDYILDRWSYVAADRGKRPKQFENDKKNEKENVCFFCPGNEKMTPPEIGRVKDGDQWKIRWFANKFPITDEKSSEDISVSGKYYKKGGAFGYHEVIVENADHNMQLASMSAEELSEVFKVYAQRVKELSQRDRIEYVQLFKNNGEEAGTSLAHTHTQIVATNLVPRSIGEEIQATKQHDRCPYCDIILQEENSERFIYSNKDFIVFSPFAPRFNYEAWIFPREHYANMNNLAESEFKNLSDAFHTILSKLSDINAPYNFHLHQSPKNANLHFHFEITPRINKWAGFELATDSYVITTSPEDSAKFYREKQPQTSHQ